MVMTINICDLCITIIMLTSIHICWESQIVAKKQKLISITSYLVKHSLSINSRHFSTREMISVRQMITERFFINFCWQYGQTLILINLNQ